MNPDEQNSSDKESTYLYEKLLSTSEFLISHR